MDTPLFKPVPEDLSALSDEDLAGIATEYSATFAAIKAKDADVIGDRTMLDILETAKAAREALNTVTAEQTKREEAVATFESEMESLTADLPEASAEEPEPEGDPEPEPTEPVEELAAEVVEEPSEAVTASMRRPLPQPRRHAPVLAPVVEEPTDGPVEVPLTAAAGLHGFQFGQELTEEGLAKAIAGAINRPVGGRQIVASASWLDAIPEERKLTQDGDAANILKIAETQKMARVNTSALVADAGQGNCAPLEPYYNLWNQSVQDRPVRDALVGFAAARGGITYMPPPSLNDFTDNGAVGSISEADQATGGTFATKTCAVITCSDIVSVQVNQVYKCLQFGNLQSRAYPEFVAQQNALAMSEWARFAETLLLDQIKAGSTQVTGLDVSAQGAVNNYFGDLLVAAAAIRSNLRLSADAPLQGIAPAWVRDELALDIVRSQFMRFDQAQAQIEDLLGRYRINMAWTLDGPSDGTQVFGVQSSGALTKFPTTVETALFPAGSWLFLDAGTLDLGIVRDSVLNQINAYQLFAETFEIAALVGVVSYWITSTLCPTGVVTAPSATTTGWC